MQTTVCAVGTLVAVVPHAQGVIVAADSRTSHADEHVDGVEKVFTVPGSNCLAFTVTGTADFFEAPAPGTPMSVWWRESTKVYSTGLVIGEYLSSHPAFAVTHDGMNGLAVAVTASIKDFDRIRPGYLRAQIGRELMRCVLVEYLDAPRITMIGTVLHSIGGSGELQRELRAT